MMTNHWMNPDSRGRLWGEKAGKAMLCLFLSLILALGTLPVSVSAADSHTHKWVEIERSKDPTCEEEGLALVRCQICGEEEEHVINRLGHSFPDDLKTAPNLFGFYWAEYSARD